MDKQRQEKTIKKDEVFTLKSKYDTEPHNIVIQKKKYATTGATSLVARVLKTGERFATLTANIEHIKPPEGYVFIKSYSENEGFYEQLVEQDVIEPFVDIIPSGFTELLVCRLNI